jgi:hypothetical protein
MVTGGVPRQKDASPLTYIFDISNYLDLYKKSKKDHISPLQFASSKKDLYKPQ